MQQTSRCGKCAVEKARTDFYPDKSKPLGHHSVCRECVKADRRQRYAADPTRYKARNRAYWLTHKEQFLEYNRAVRRRALDAYGNRCACCGETTAEFLGIDHVNNDGEAHRRELKGYGRAIYQWLAKEGFPQDGRFQLLCHTTATWRRAATAAVRTKAQSPVGGEPSPSPAGHRTGLPKWTSPGWRSSACASCTS